MEREIAKHKKKSKRTAPKKLDHKHNKIKCIVKYHYTYGNKSNIWFMLGWYCSICGKVKGERLEPNENLKEKYPNLEIKEEVEE